jgi:hypothetical protein
MLIFWHFLATFQNVGQFSATFQKWAFFGYLSKMGHFGYSSKHWAFFSYFLVTLVLGQEVPPPRITELIIMTFSMMTISTKALYVTLSISDNQHK